jgi:hypothetical protein
MKKLCLAALLLGSAIAVWAADKDPFIGTWNLDVAKSTFDPGPGPKSETVTIAPDQVTVHETGPDGGVVDWSYAVAGADTPSKITGLPGGGNPTVTEHRKGNVVEHTWHFDNGEQKGRGVISDHGKVLRYTMTGTDAQGRTVNNKLVFEKQ